MSAGECALTAMSLALLLWSAAPQRASAGVLDIVRAAGALDCGVIVGAPDDQGDDPHSGLAPFGADVCRAMATAVLGAPDAARIVAFAREQDGLLAVHTGRVALLAGATPGRAASAAFRVAFGPPLFLDGQGFLVRRDDGIATFADLSDRQVCFLSGTPAETALQRALDRGGLTVRRFPFEEPGEMQAALVSGHCAAITADLSRLATWRLGLHAISGEFVLLSEAIAVDPWAPSYADDDPDWGRIVALVAGVLQSEAPDNSHPADAAVSRMDELGAALGLRPGWTAAVRDAVGGYDAIYDRDLGAGSPLGLPAGCNLRLHASTTC